MDTKKFHKSITQELLSVKDRVRDLVTHWGEDGIYKEAILKTVLNRCLPIRYKMGSGFVVRQTNVRGVHESSNQIDILIYDSHYPVLFKEGDFVIVTADSVKAIIEVKANLENQGVADVLTKANENGKFIFDGSSSKDVIFNGVFSFEGNENSRKVTYESSITNSLSSIVECDGFQKYCVNHISFNKDYFYKHWYEEWSIYDENVNLYDIEKPHKIYRIMDLSFSFFISNLMDYLNWKSVKANSNLWFCVDKSVEIFHEF